jgi:AcrR family transcriptional regulator
MTDPTRLQTRMTSAARAAWIDAARDILIAGGVPALNLRGLAGSLGVTTGAFYSAFSGLEDLHEALREKCRDQNTTPLITAMAAAGDDGFRQYLAGLKVTVLDGGIDPRFDNAMRDWAHSSPRTAQVLTEVEALRIDLLTRMFLALGFDDKRAVIRARITYFHQVGHGAMEIRDDPDERLMNLRFYAEALVGRSDLMICETAEEVRQFILTGLPPR